MDVHMPFKKGLFLVTLLLILGVTAVILFTNRKIDPYATSAASYSPGVNLTVDTAVSQSQTLYKQKKALGEDFSSGPCLTNDLMEGWVADTVHVPRTDTDNQVANECQAYVEGRAKHVVELNETDGSLVRVY